MSVRWFVLPLLILIVAIGVGVWFFSAAGTVPQTVSPPAPVETTTPKEPPLFEDVTLASGIEFTYRNGEDLVDAEGQIVLDADGKPRRHLAILESLGGGVGLIDYDGDGRLDLFFAGGGHYVDPPEYHTIAGYPSRLFRNLGDFKFTEVTSQVGLATLANGEPWFYSHGVAVADYDRDGWPDLLVTGWERVALFRNTDDGRGGRKFVDVTDAAGLGQGIEWASAAGFGDLDGDGYPDLYVCQYVDWSWDKHPPCTYDGKVPDVCPPKNFDGLRHKLYRNQGDGTFADVSDEVALRPGPDGKGLGVLIADFDGDYRPDLYVANDTVDNFLYLNRSTPGAIHLDERGMLTGTARDDRGTPNGSMGLDAGDPERSGKPALWVTNYQNELHAMYSNVGRPGQPMFHFRTAGAGIAAIGQKYVGWGTGFIDVDLDGWEDLFVTNGHAVRFPGGKQENRPQRPVLLLNQRGKFKESTIRLGAYAEREHTGRGLGIGDLDNDGRADLVLCHMNEPAAILRGIGGDNNGWLGVELVGRDHACTVGARLVLETEDAKLTRFSKGGGSYASSSDRRFAFGLGKSSPRRLVVSWPDGTEESFEGLAPGRYHRIVQGSGEPSGLQEGRQGDDQ